MRIISVILFASLICLRVEAADVKRLSEPVQVDVTSETFGEGVNSWPQEVTLEELLAEPEEFLQQRFSLETPVSKVCKIKGCFFIAQQGPNLIRVAFKDYGFFVPTDIDGKKIKLIGELIRKEVSTKQAEHFNKDLTGKDDGNKALLKSGQVYEVLASTVRVPLS